MTYNIYGIPTSDIVSTALCDSDTASLSTVVIKEGVYSSKSLLACTRPPNKSQIPDDYIVETTWGR
ncbi:44762_t:CDS:2, partial [Gigaspora margarita]